MKLSRLFDLSLRHKIPLWGSLLIIVSTAAVSAALLARTYDDLKQDLFTSSTSLGQTLAHTLFPALLHDDLWRAFEIIRAPLQAQATHNPMEADVIFIIDAQQKILASTDPKMLPTLGDLGADDGEFRQLAHALAKAASAPASRVYELEGAGHYYTATPIAQEGRQLGLLIVSHARHKLWSRFFEMTARSAAMGALVLAVILPINWYWGRRTAEPLVALSKGMGDLVAGLPPTLPANLYTYHDELGRLFLAYREAAQALHEKTLLEQEVVRSERLAAVGRLAAGIAHEVNNPVGGMLMALDNLRQRGAMEPAVAKTAAMLERGLHHISDTVGALLVEARVSSRPLGASDFDDLRTLIEPQVRKKQIQLDWRVAVEQECTLPAASVRQVLINLLLNACQATPEQGRIGLSARANERQLELVVTNSGPPLPAHVREHLFEPFVSGREGGHGLGLWVSYLTVTQLGGQITACNEGEGEGVCFRITLPMETQSA